MVGEGAPRTHKRPGNPLILESEGGIMGHHSCLVLYNVCYRYFCMDQTININVENKKSHTDFYIPTDLAENQTYQTRSCTHNLMTI